MKQWMKCAAVVCSFLIMSGVFFPDSGNKVSASETGTVSDGNTVQSWSTTVSYVLEGGNFTDEVREECFPDYSTNEYSWVYTTNSGADMTFIITIHEKCIPEKEGYTFTGWLCSVDNATYQPNTTLEFKYSLGTVTLTAQWTANDSGETGTGGESAGEAAGTSFTDTGTYSVKAGLEYGLGEGTWTVNNGSDGCEYVGGTSFYVKESGEYTFTKN